MTARTLSVAFAATAALLALTPAIAKDGGKEVRTQAKFVRTGVDPDASGKAVFRSRPNRTRFKVQVQHATPGPADLQVGGTSVGTITVGSLGRGELEFRDPVGDDADKLPLTFDPRSQMITVLQNGQAILSVVLGGVPGSNSNGNGSGSSVGDQRIETNLVSTGAIGGASGKAKWRARKGGRLDFGVEIEDIPAGSYTLRVDGVEVAKITATPLAGTSSAEGEIEFSNPQDAGKPLLTFDPRGKLIEVLDGSTVILQQVFPAGP